MKKSIKLFLLGGVTLNLFGLIIGMLDSSHFELIKSSMANVVSIIIYFVYVTLVGIVLPIILLRRDLHNENIKKQVVFTITICLINVVYFSFRVFVPSVTQYLIINSLGLMDIYVEYLSGIPMNGLILMILGNILITIGSALCLLKGISSTKIQ